MRTTGEWEENTWRKEHVEGSERSGGVGRCASGGFRNIYV